MIDVFHPTVGPEEADAVAEVLASGWVGTGPRVAEFERAFAKHLGGVPDGRLVSMTCATETLYQVFDWIAGHRSGAEVVLPANAFIGAANAARDAGFELMLCDVDPRTLNPTVAHIRTMVTSRTAAVLVQHFGGVPSNQEEIAAYCQANDLLLIEDCACAPASLCAGLPSGLAGNFGVWSFDAMKVMTAGDGGMLYCWDADISTEIRRQTRLGQDELTGQSSERERWWEFNVEIPGRRAMMNDVAAAIGLAQLAKLPALVARRRAIWDAYQRALAGLPWLTLPPEPQPGERSSYYCYWVQVAERDALARHLRERGIYTTFRYWPVHRAYGWSANVPNTNWVTEHTLLLPLHASLSDGDVEFVCDAVRSFERVHA